MRGEHVIGIGSVIADSGSSPHARGARCGQKHCSSQGGIIPACAGSTSAASHRSSSPRDHPRMRGEHACWRADQDRQRGSSPHARGAQQQAAAFAHGQGIIPACAGSTSTRLESSAGSRDHPRMRGEHGKFIERIKKGAGSSPHARGAPDTENGHQALRGIIPACAGSTISFSMTRWLARDHPRMRGEHKMEYR